MKYFISYTILFSSSLFFTECIEFNMHTPTLKEIEEMPSKSMIACFEDDTKDVFGECFPKMEAEFDLMKQKMDKYKQEMEAEKQKASKQFDKEMSDMDTELKKYDADFKKQEKEFDLEMGEKFDQEIQKNVVDVFKGYETPA